MAGNAYLTTNTAGAKIEVRANQTSAGAGDAGKIVALNSAGLVDPTMANVAGAVVAGANVTRTGSGTVADPYVFSATTSGPTTVTATAHGAISAGQLVNFYSNGGVLTAQAADNTTAGTEANGYATTGVADGASGSFSVGGIITGLSGLTLGATYYLGKVGAVIASSGVASLTAGNILQVVGKALSATTLDFTPEPAPITLA